MEIPQNCTLCPRQCGIDRRTEQGVCGGGNAVRLARAALHFDEEPCISGTRGSGAVFFSGCPLKCIYCQNYHISTGNFGKDITTAQLAEIFLRLQAQGAHNLNLVSAQHYLPWVLEALDAVRGQLHIPIVYNTGGYETLEAVHALRDIVDIWLTDIKYATAEPAKAYSAAKDYFPVASAALTEMIAQTGTPQYDENGLMTRGVLVRHLALPGGMQDTNAVLQYLAGLPKGSFRLSLMSQYTPCGAALQVKPLDRRISTYEYRHAINTAVTLGLTDGYMQQRESANAKYTPDFDLTGLEKY